MSSGFLAVLRHRQFQDPAAVQEALAASVVEEILDQLDDIADKAADSPTAGAAISVITDLADALHGHLVTITEVVGQQRPPSLPYLGHAERENCEWTLPLIEALQTADEPLGRVLTASPRSLEAEQAKFKGQRALGGIRAALTGADRRLDSITEAADARARMEQRGTTIHTFRVERR